MRILKIGESDVFAGDETSVVEELKETLGACAICVLYDAGVAGIADEVAAKLKDTYRIFRYEVLSARDKRVKERPAPPEFVRHIVGIGTGSVAEECKLLAEELDVEWSIFLSAPTTDTILCGKPPKNVFIARNVMINCPSCCLAAGYGILFSQPLSVFEEVFSNKVLSLKKAETCGKEDATDAVELALRLLEISALKQEADSAEITARLMHFIAIKAGKRPRLMGEYKFLASSLITEFYSAYLSSPSIDCMPPAAMDDALDKLSYLGAKDIIRPKRVDFFDVNAYFKISYILSEYRMDLLEKLDGINSLGRQRFWRRLYPDAGYWLKSEVTSSELMSAMTLAGAFSDSLLGLAFASGIFARFCAG